MRNKNYEIALNWVKEKYPFFFGDNISLIQLVPLEIQPRAYGTHRFVDGKSEIRISNVDHEVWDYIDTIVHELVHSAQYLLNEKNVLCKERSVADFNDIEQHADGLAFEAQLAYKKEKGIPIWK